MRRIYSLVSVPLMRAVLVGCSVVLSGAPFSLGRGQETLSSSHVSGLLANVTVYDKILSPPAQEEAVFPHSLSISDAEKYRAAFWLLRNNRLKEGLNFLKTIHDPILISDVQAETYLREGSHPTVKSLSAWVKSNPSSPDSAAIRVLQKRIVAPNSPIQDPNPIMSLDDLRSSLENGGSASVGGKIERNDQLDRTVQDEASQGVKGAKGALRLIDRLPGVTSSYAAYLYSNVALVLLSQGKVEAAYAVGVKGFDRGNKKIGSPAFVAGLAAWHEGKTSDAYAFFSAAANSSIIEGDQRAAAAFWAARVAKSAQAPYSYEVWLHRAAVHTESLYGQLAEKILEQEQHTSSSLSGLLSTVGLHGARSMLTRADIDAVMSMDEGHHLFSLLQIGEQGRAEVLARYMWKSITFDPMRARSLQLVVRYAGMQALSEQMTHLLNKTFPQALKESAAPLPVLRPKHGFRLNPALVYAVARMESNFNGNALSPAGACGMMQIRPQTAGFIAASYIDHTSHNPSSFDVPVDMPRRLQDVGYNLEIGQLYMKYLASSVARGKGNNTTDKQVDLVRVLASYNAGPQAILRWENVLENSFTDPLYYMEILPSSETRHYVHNVLKTTWLYARRMNYSSPSLNSLSKGRWPSFHREEASQDSPS